MSDTDTRDRCRGVLVGLAAGDRIGGPVRMAVRLAESLADRAAFDPSDVLARYLDWWRAGAFDTGPVADQVLALVAAGTPVHEATAQVHRETGGLTAGCNPAHRAPPLAMAAAITDADLAACAAAEAGLTHHDPLAGGVSAAAGGLCRALVRGAGWEEAVRAFGPPGCDEPPDDAGGYSPAVYRAAVYFVGTSGGFVEALDRAVAFAGPSNYCPVLAGAIGGARWGEAAIPAGTLAHVAILPRVRAAADALASGWTGGEQ
jgi:ADP-ribosylglycohydrolase